MTRDNYKGIPKRVAVLLPSLEGELEAIKEPRMVLVGTVSLLTHRTVVSGTLVRSGVIATPHHGPLTYAAFDGYVVVSGTGNGEFVYQIIC